MRYSLPPTCPEDARDGRRLEPPACGRNWPILARHRRLVESRASRTTFTTVRQNGAAVSPRRESRCAEYRMKWLAWMLVPLMALGWVVSASATVRIHSDTGGRIDQYLDRYNQIRLSGQRVVDGTCHSVCTLIARQRAPGGSASPSRQPWDSMWPGSSMTREGRSRAPGRSGHFHRL